MMNKLKYFHIKGPVLIEGKIYKDNRGYFYESHNKKALNKSLNLNINFLQDNTSFSKCGVFRGFHLQRKPYEQGKLVRVVCGSIIDYVIDLRSSSKTFGKHISVVLNADENHQLWIPKGFAHGFYALDDSVVSYKIDNEYDPKSEITLDYKDPDLNIELPCSNPIVSDKDQLGISFKKYKNDFIQ